MSTSSHPFDMPISAATLPVPSQDPAVTPEVYAEGVWQDFLASSWHGLPARETRHGQDARATVTPICQKILPHT